MIYSNTKEDFDSNYMKALELLHHRDKRHAKHETALRNFESEKNSYASYILRKKREREESMGPVFLKLTIQAYSYI